MSKNAYLSIKMEQKSEFFREKLDQPPLFVKNQAFMSRQRISIGCLINSTKVVHKLVIILLQVTSYLPADLFLYFKSNEHVLGYDLFLFTCDRYTDHH